ncbi:aspartate, mitochondrial [Raphidocelis subcapitata]|uniref:Aspartate aminotransferase n=1 Tax=Raphidocelis subcapitata TaxID=307507 RepID=A0A2V0NKA3_9CHLO|nr:aspartate, mitochondrial [Raphidocelis subcapitata]|eukprot:GBF87409.1 aspartate, mitochondrial [Raphidocelis subcapitata]
MAMAGPLAAAAAARSLAAASSALAAGARAFASSSAAAAARKSWFSDVGMAPRDPILGVTEKFLADTSPDKINLGVGAYRDDSGKPVVLDCVREAERRIAGKDFMEYLPIGGLRDFVTESVKLAYGDACPDLSNVAAVQSLSGTGSCRLMAEFQRRFMPHSTVYIPVPTWSNHHSIWRDAGVPQSTYRYYKPETKGLDFEGLMEDVKAAPSGSLFLLHACAHNPTGVDPTPEQWAAISKLMAERGHFPFFDMAYQGFASGDCDKDSGAIRTFLRDGHRLGVSQSYAKNMGMYGQRIGAFSIVCDSKDEAARVESQMKLVARPMYSNPPLHGALMVKTILRDPQLKAQWFAEVRGMAERIISMRALLRRNLEQLGSQHSWKHITDQIGMFAYSGMTPEMVDTLAAKHSIYMTRNGRISMAGVNTKNVARLASAMHEVTK